MIKHKLFTLLVALCATTALWAGNVITYTATEKLEETTDAGSAGLHTNAFDVSISSHTFSNGVGTVTFAGEVTRIGDHAFYNCNSLTSITIPNSVTTIGSEAFKYCDGLKTVYNNSNLYITKGSTYNGYVAYYADKVYKGIPVGDFIIKQDTIVTAYIGSATDIVIPNFVTTIGKEAFIGCSGLTSVTIPNSVTTIGIAAFYGCSGLTSISVDAANTHYVSIDGVLFNYAKNRLIQYPVGNSRTEYTIPNSVTTIGDYAFEHCYRLKTVTIPNSVTTIGDDAFIGCDGLTSVTIPNSVTTIGDEAFWGCRSLTSITIPNSVKTIGNYAFWVCYNLTSVTIGNSVTTIGEETFFGCSKLASIDVDAANTHYASMDGVLFNYAKGTLIQYPIGNTRTEYTIPNSVTTIGEWAFSGCHGLTSITIPNSVTTIGYDAFEDCHSLTSITIPNSVTTIGNYAFQNCYGLTSITCEAAIPPACGYECFFDVDKSIPLYVPAGSVKAYKAADEWKKFTDIRPITAKEVEVTEIESTPAESAVEIAWPSVVNAETYTIEIRLGDQLICSIVFNAQGQLVSINFNLAPGRGGHTYATTAESTATGWAYTIAGLNPGTNYTYSVIAKNADEQVIDTKSGSFTTHDMPMGIDNVNINANANSTKTLRNGQVLIRKDGKTYNVLGQEVK